jgi:hypothetical protein
VRIKPSLSGGQPVKFCTGSIRCHGLDRENRVGLREICRVSRREISQAGRDALALARLAFSFLAHQDRASMAAGRAIRR